MTGHRDVRHRLEQYAANPGCEANRLSAVHDIPMEDVVKARGGKPALGQSPFAIARGQSFERLLFEKNASRLLKALIDKRVVPENASGFVDLRISKNSGPMADVVASRTAFHNLLNKIKSTPAHRRSVPTIVAGACLMVPGKSLLADGYFSLDVLTFHPDTITDKIVLRVGEIKVYPDRGGFTDPHELAGARAQAGLYVYALRSELERWALTSAFEVANDGFLILSKPGSNMVSVRPREDLRYQAARAEEAYDLLRSLAEEQAQTHASQGPLTIEKRLQIIENAATEYKPTCLGFCELANVCHDKASAEELPIVLGDELARFLGPIPLNRAIELIHGAVPVNDFERSFKKRTA